YGFDIVPRFWSWLDEMVSAGSVYSVLAVYDELAAGNDDVSVWVKTRKNSGLFVDPDGDVQKFLGSIADFVVDNYETQQTQVFLGGADPWVVAQAYVDKSTVVTHETLVGVNSKKVKIPNICSEYGVPFVNTYQMMRTLGASFQ
ncbi:MAG: DUF4411 family protein, partial [Spirochaetaceae bacterium]|nr:DUF4411 family protein [Spirochaetaceae bacterium]